MLLLFGPGFEPDTISSPGRLRISSYNDELRRLKSSHVPRVEPKSFLIGGLYRKCSYHYLNEKRLFYFFGFTVGSYKIYYTNTRGEVL